MSAVMPAQSWSAQISPKWPGSRAIKSTSFFVRLNGDGDAGRSNDAGISQIDRFEEIGGRKIMELTTNVYQA
jgi:hypothetical protein